MGFGVDEFETWSDKVGFDYSFYADGTIIIETIEGDMEAHPGDFVIKGIQGEFYPCKEDIFKKTYDPV